MAAQYGSDLRNALIDRSMRTAGPTSGPEYPDPSIQGPDRQGGQQRAQLSGSRENSFDMSSGVPTAPTGLPATPPGNKAALPPAWQRYATGLKMQNAYANNWQPNPIMLLLLNGK